MIRHRTIVKRFNRASSRGRTDSLSQLHIPAQRDECIGQPFFIALRNNVIHNTNFTSIIIHGYDASYDRHTVDVTIENNTAINNGTRGHFLKVEGDVEGITLTHNLYVAPNHTTGSYGTAIVYIEDDDMDSFRQVSNNIWNVPTTLGYAQGGYFYLWNNWSDSRGYLTPQEWDSYSVVSNEKFQDVTLATNIFQATVSGTTAGAKLAA